MFSYTTKAKTSSSNRSNDLARSTNDAFLWQFTSARSTISKYSYKSLSRKSIRKLERDQDRVNRILSIPTFTPSVIDRGLSVQKGQHTYFFSDKTVMESVHPPLKTQVYASAESLDSIEDGQSSPLKAITFTDKDAPGGPVYVFTRVDRDVALRRIGRKSLKELLHALKEITVTESSIKRGKHVGEVMTTLVEDFKPLAGRKKKNTEKVAATYVTVGISSCMASHGLYNRKIKHKDGDTLGKILFKYRENIGHLLAQYSLPAVNRAFSDWLGKGLEWSVNQGGACIDRLPGMIIGQSVFLSLHTDRDTGIGAISIHCEDDAVDLGRKGCNYKMNSPIIAYFVFPTYGCKVPLRAGDVLLFNSQVPHCITSPTPEYVNKRYFATSCYLKQSVASLHDNRKKYVSQYQI